MFDWMYETGLGEDMVLRTTPAIVDDEDQATLESGVDGMRQEQ